MNSGVEGVAGAEWRGDESLFDTIENFRGIRSAKLVLPDHAVLIGDNNTGKART